MRYAFEELKEAREAVFSEFSNGVGGSDFFTDYTEVIDQYFRRGLEESETGQRLFRKKNPFAFVAVGGYGRQELCPHSDIDILILFRSKIPEMAKELAQDVFYPLWDLGLDIGYGVRNIKDCVSLSANDFEVLTSLMDARFVCGDSPLYLSLMEILQKKIVSKKSTAFARWLDDQDKIRMGKFGDASYMLEPHLKEGVGGLRDYHHILWLAKAHFELRAPRDLEYHGKLSHNEYQELGQHLKFMWLVRSHLHLLSGRRNDQLYFDYQEKISNKMGFGGQGGSAAVEKFLGKLHASMAFVKSLHRYFSNTHLPKRGFGKIEYKPGIVSDDFYLNQGEIYFESSTAILSNPYLLMEIFEKCSALGCRLSLESKRLIQEFLYLIDDSFRRSGVAAKRFFTIINNRYTLNALDQMFETGFLEHWIPEFRNIKDRVQFDTYHIYPVGRHSLETLRRLKEISKQKEFLLVDILSELSDPQPLFIAAFLHDFGKTGRDHAEKGVTIAHNILSRLGYDDRRTETVLFLIRHHLLLTETATRRDLNDEKVVVTCARLVGDMERLKMLYLLTWADSKATGPKAWSAWTFDLVQELFFKIIHVLEGKELATAHASEKENDILPRVRRSMAGQIESQELENFFDIMTPRYLLNASPKDVAFHISLVQKLRPELGHGRHSAFVSDVREDASGDCWEMVFSAKDRLGLFSDLAGVMALNNLNILSAEVYTWRDGTALDVFRVTRPLDRLHPEKTWMKVNRDLETIFQGKLSLPDQLREKLKPSVRGNRKKPSHPPKVTIDNKSSDFFTLIEVFADDHVGLLYKITRTLFELLLDIRIAKIATKVDQIADVFYVRDLDGQKVEDEDQLKQIKEALNDRLSYRNGLL